MASCCEDKGCEVTALRESHGRVLWAVLVINAVMFVVEAYSGIVAHSTSLLADSLDMLGDAIVYGFSLFVLAKSLRWQALAAVIKGVFMLVFGIGVLLEAVYKVFNPVVPNAELMGTIGALALFANLVCFGMLYRHRSDNLNMSSTWLCSRNDLIANVGVLIAAGASYWLTSRWPDIAVGTLIAGLFLHSSASVLKEALDELRKPPSEPVKHPQAVAVGVGMPVRRNKKTTVD
ncbi:MULTISPECIES: cation diffusion facilitator family transporter [unclassified Methylophilus]|uniref:cation diffusion facilitator family transporter n=1 Tax=unclassified Methylophilus TaxID=2630143 RepID=UPI00037C78E2|nr:MULTISPECIES: cation diffusion facilitator family transporter [unclassified Methylophilus]